VGGAVRGIERRRRRQKYGTAAAGDGGGLGLRKETHVNKAVFGSKVLLKYLSNTTVFKNTTVSNTLMCLALTKNCSINTLVSFKV
jgi:hypothetical protein